MMREQTTNATELSVASKERLARLLATENIFIEHRSDAPTAMFDIKNRTLVLPTWKDMTKELYDLLVLHEVGHALWTPLEGWHNAVTEMGPNFKSFLNVIEDARIEKKIKRKYPGGRSSFITGYKDLLDRDFFGTKTRPVESYNLIDRINLHFKGGLAMGVQFTDAEQVYVDRIADAETWADVESIARDLWDEAADGAESETGQNHDFVEGDVDPDGDGQGFAIDEDGDPNADDDSVGDMPMPPNDSGDTDSTDGDSAQGDDSDGADSDADAGSESDAGDGDASEDDTNSDSGKNDDASGDNADSDDSDGDSAPGDLDGSSEDPDATNNADANDDPSQGDNPSQGDLGTKGSGEGTFGGQPFSETDKAFRDREDDLVDLDNHRNQPTYTQVPADDAFNLDAIIVPHATIHKSLMATLADYSGHGGFSPDIVSDAKRDLKIFKTKNAKLVNYMAKEFEMRKAADASARATTSRTGVLDMTTLHSYKWNDDVFKKITNIPDGKNHGLQMYVDWSGSMSSNMFGSMEQILNLVMFCKKVNIPFDVYAFSDAADAGDWNDQESKIVYTDRLNSSKLKRGDWTFRKSAFKLLQLASSNAKGATAFNNMLLDLIILRGHFNHHGQYGNPTQGISYFPIPGRMKLGGTPLNEAVMSAIPITNRFQEVNGLQIVNTVFLTDGEGATLHSVVKSNHSGEVERGGYGSQVIVRDRQSRKEFVSGYNQTTTFLEIFRLRTNSKIVNFYVCDNRPHGFKREYSRAAGESNLNSNNNEEYPYQSRRRNQFSDAVNAAWKTAKAEGGVVIENGTKGWDHHYLIPGGASLIMEDEGNLDDDLIGAKKGQLKRAFAKQASGKLRNRVVLKKFTELIAA